MSPIYEDHRSKRYEPPAIDLENKNTSLVLLIELTGRNKDVLEVGTSTGYVSRVLKERGNTVTGIEIDPEAGEIAGQHCDSMIIGDIEKLDLDTYLAPSSIDVIIFGDVLEHLASPGDVLRKVKKYLRSDGFLTVSLPNVCHGDVILNLLMGNFGYTSMGLLDATHLRFFGLRNIIDLFSRCGYSITDIHTTVLPVGGTELKVDPGLVPEDLANFVKSLPNSSVYQYVFKASPSPGPETEETVPVPDLDGLFRGAIEGSIQAEIKPLLEELSAYKTRTASLDEQIEQLTVETQSLQRTISERDAQVASLDEQIAQSGEELQSLKQTLTGRDEQIASLNEQTRQQAAQLMHLSNELAGMRQSVVWQLLMKYHNGLVERALPHSTRRRKFYDLGLVRLRNLVREGPGGLWIRGKKWLHERFALSSLQSVSPIVRTSLDAYNENIPLTLDSPLVGCFTSPANQLHAIEILTATYERHNADLKLSIREGGLEGPIVREAVINGNEIVNNGHSRWVFESIPDSRDTTYCFQLVSIGSPPAAVWYNRAVSHDELHLFRNGEKLNGQIGFRCFTKEAIPDPYALWRMQNEPTDLQLEEMKEVCKTFPSQPKISIIMPVWNTDERWLRCAIESVLKQTYGNWELCIADGGSTKPYIKQILREYAENDSRIKVSFHKDNKGISGNSNEALSLATGEYIGFLDHDDEIAPNALYEVIKLLNKRPGLDIIYSDNDKIDESGLRKDPFFKPDWSLPFLLSTNYVFHLLIAKTSLVKKAGGLHCEYDGAQDYDLVLRMIEHTTKERIGHIQKVLYHWRIIESSSASGGSAKPYAYEAGKRAINAYLTRRGVDGEVFELEPGSYRVKYAIQYQSNIGVVLVSQDNMSKDYTKFIRFLINHSTHQIRLICLPKNTKISQVSVRTVEYSRSFEEIYELIQKERLEHLIFIDFDRFSKISVSSLRIDWIEALLEQYVHSESGVVGTGAPVFGHVVQNVYRPCGPVFCVNCRTFMSYVQSTDFKSSFNALQIGLADLSDLMGYPNIFTPFAAGNLTTEKTIALYYSDLNSHPFFTRNMKYYLKDIVHGGNRENYDLDYKCEISSREADNLPLREKIASEYIRGEGIEIGALHQPLTVPNNVSIKYVDRLRSDDLILHYPELKGCDIVRPDIIDDAQTLASIENDRYDFCIANHVFEHMKDPIGALLNWIRVIKPGGILYLSVPDISNPLDTGRDLTTLEHLIADNLDGSDSGDFYHFIECAKHWNKLSDEREIQRIAQENYEKDYSIHYHTFNGESLDKILSYLLSGNPDLFDIINVYKNTINGTNEYIYILEKGTYLAKCFEILEKYNAAETTAKPAIDVIIPVYNAYTDLIRCFYSLLSYQTSYRIILINDCSSDSRIHELFEKLHSFESDRLRLVNNEKNLGFVKTVNRGMQSSHLDVILLNSDTIVTKGWAEKLLACAYSDDTIGTVTPFTNNGTICSIPEFCKENAIPEGFTVDSYAGFIEKNSFQQCYEIPTAVGFCMLIKRELLEKIGYFDDEAFGKGYGEENDFCMRAIRAGYRNVLCDNTYVYHKGEASFSEAKADLLTKNMEVLSNKYPEYLKDVASFCRLNPIQDFQEYISTRAQTWDIVGDKKRILYVLHHLGGGTEKHVLELLDGLAGMYIFYVVQVQDATVCLTEYNNGTKVAYRFPLSEQVHDLISPNSGYRSILAKIIATFDIDLIHVHHLLGHTIDIFSVAKECRIPVVFTVHDYYAVCPRINLLDDMSRYCHNINNLESCANCLSKTLQLPRGYIKEWRHCFLHVFKECSCIVAPSQSAIDILYHYYPEVANKSLVIGHGHGKGLLNLQPTTRTHSGDLFHIGCIGVLAQHKGLKLFYKLARDGDFTGKVKWSVFGTSDIHSEPGYYPTANIIIHGTYSGYEELRSMVQEEPVDLMLFLSTWPETFSYTLSEAWALGIPVLVSDLGALKERVKENGGGWTVDVSDAEEVKRKIASTMRDRADYLIKKAEVSNITLKSLEDVAGEYSTLYSRLIGQSGTHYLKENMFSNKEIFASMVRGSLSPKSVQHPLSWHEGNKVRKGLFSRLVLCHKENGLWYTIKKAFMFPYAAMTRE